MNLSDFQAHDALLGEALQLQRSAYLANPNPGRTSRLQDLRQLRALVADNTDALCDAICADYGHRSRHETLLTEVLPALTSIDHAMKHLKRWMRVQRRPVDRLSFGLASNRVVPQPLGVVGVIVPWNFPLNLSMVPLSAILAAGNRAMVKMSENSRHLARCLQELAPRYLPHDKLRFFDETGGVGVAFSRQKFDHLLFTGSGQTGRAVMAAAAQNLCPVTLELGGKSPALIAPDFDLRTAVERVMYVKCLNAGQICTTVDVVYVPRARLEEFVALARAVVRQRFPAPDARTPSHAPPHSTPHSSPLASPDYTALINPAAYQRLRDALDEARAGGATVVPLLEGPQHDDASHKLAPQLVLDAPAECALMQREIFGPVLPVLPYDSVDEVIADINRRPRPLAFYPFSHDEALLQRLLDHVMSGGVSINDGLFHVAQHDLPFGGVGDSGMGHYHGEEGFQTFSKMRPVFRQSRWFSTASLLYPPYGPRIDRLLAFLLKR
jgi:coniferyl-aldehyde dehydrogenase